MITRCTMPFGMRSEHNMQVEAAAGPVSASGIPSTPYLSRYQRKSGVTGREFILFAAAFVSMIVRVTLELLVSSFLSTSVANAAIFRSLSGLGKNVPHAIGKYPRKAGPSYLLSEMNADART